MQQYYLHYRHKKGTKGGTFAILRKEGQDRVLLIKADNLDSLINQFKEEANPPYNREMFIRKYSDNWLHDWENTGTLERELSNKELQEFLKGLELD